MMTVWQKVGHEQLFHINKKILARTFKKYIFTMSFFLSLHQTTKEFLAFIKATIHAFVISITCIFSVD